MKEENYEVVVFQGDPGPIDLTYEEIEAEWNKMLQTVPQIGKFRIIHQEKKRYTFEDYSSQIGNADAALGIWVHKGVINEKLFEAHPNLKYIATLGHGFEDFDVEMTRRRGVTITNTIYGDVTIAQYAMALLMNICHNVTVQSDYTKTGYWKEKETNPQASYNQLFVPQIELYQKTMGIIGLGAIGRRVAQIARAFGANVIYYSASGRPAQDGYTQVDFDTLLTTSDIISVHAPLNEHTENLLDKCAFAKMKETCIFLNLGRGPIVVEQDLYDALVNGEIAAAGLDVLSAEPMSEKNPLIKIQDSRRLFITPHIAWASVEARTRLMQTILGYCSEAK